MKPSRCKPSADRWAPRMYAAIASIAVIACARPAHAGAHGRFSVAIDGGSVTYLTPSTVSGGYAVGASMHVTVWNAISIGTGLRYARGPFFQQWGALDGYGVISLRPTFRAWAPRVGIEFGLSTASRLYVPPEYPAEFDYAHRAPPGAFFVGVDLAPARFKFGHFAVSLFGIGIGIPIPTADSVRLTLRYAEVEWQF